MAKYNHITDYFNHNNKGKKHEQWIDYVTKLNNSVEVAKLRLSDITIEYKHDFIDYKPIALNLKIDKFCKDYQKYDYYKDTTYIDIYNFIEKMAIWYELRYPNKEVEFLFSEERNFNNRQMIYIKENINTLTWKEILNYQTFYNTLSNKEQEFLEDPIYNQSYNIINAYNGPLFISKDGIINTREIRLNVTRENSNYGEMLYINTDFDGLNIFQAQKLFEMYGMFDDAASMKDIINDYQKQIERKERLLDCVMYRIIERGENRIGSRRAYLFAKEFKRNYDIPLMYGIDTSDPHLHEFINIYLNDGGNINLKCIMNYHLNNNASHKLVPLSTILEKENKHYQKRLEYQNK